MLLMEPGRLRPRQQRLSLRVMCQARGRGHLLLVGLLKTELLFLLDKLLLLKLQKGGDALGLEAAAAAVVAVAITAVPLPISVRVPAA